MSPGVSGERPSGAGGGSPEPPRSGGTPAVIPVVYDYIQWMAPKLAAFPKVHRFTLGDRIMGVMLEVLESLIVAQYDRRDRRGALRAANLALERLRYLVRLARDLQCLSLSEYEHSARQLVEAGQQVGGWLRSAGASGGGG